MQTLSTEPDAAALSNSNYPSIRLSPLTGFAADTLPGSQPCLSPYIPFHEFCAGCSLVHSFIAFIYMLWASAISHALMLGAGNLKMNETQFLCSPGF